MKNIIYLLALTLTIPVAGLAQANLDTELARELDQLYLKQQQASAGPRYVQAAPANGNAYFVQSPQAGIATAPIASPVMIQQQPTTLVQAPPLEESRADQARRRRQQAELINEQRMVEKLEEDRYRAEQMRLNRVFPGNNINNEVVANVNTDQQQTVVTNPQQVVIVEEPKVRPPIAEHPIYIENGSIHNPAHPIGHRDNPYFAGSIGWGEYLDAPFIRGNMALGVALGKVLPNNFVVEGSFIYSTYEVLNVIPFFPNNFQNCAPFGCGQPVGVAAIGKVVEMQQYNFSGGVKYEFLSGTIRPSVGGVAGYTYRNYRDKNNFGYGYTPGYDFNCNGYSHAFDLGLTAGLDVRVSPDFSIGAEGRYMFNLKHWISSDPIRYMMYSNVQNSIENMNYYLFGLNLKFAF